MRCGESFVPEGTDFYSSEVFPLARESEYDKLLITSVRLLLDRVWRITPAGR